MSSQHTVSGPYRPTSETPFRLRVDSGPRFCVYFVRTVIPYASSGARCVQFDLELHICHSLVCVSSEGSGKDAHIVRLRCSQYAKSSPNIVKTGL